jgi:hypothetical protein
LLLAAACLAGCSGPAPQTEAPPTDAPAPTGYLVGGTVTNLTRTGLVLTLETQQPGRSIERTDLSVDPFAISFVFPNHVGAGAFYSIEVKKNPSDQICAVLQASGAMGDGHVMSVAVSCSVIAHLTDAPALSTGRFRHTATLLNDGRVLVAGGIGDCPTSPTTASVQCALSTAELYDPAAGRFTPTGGMAVARDAHTATLLPDGRVLVAGGAADPSENDVLASAEIYDPVTGRFAAAGQMIVARSSHSATRLANGGILLVGGETGPGSFTATAELYDPASGTFSFTGSLVAVSFRHTATLLEDGRVLIAGGNGREVAELYDPATETFALTGSMMMQRWGCLAVLLQDGTVLMGGGQFFDGDPILSADLYDPATGTFSSLGPMFAPTGTTATRLPDGAVVFAGGSTTEIYDPTHRTFLFASATLPAASVATLLADGRLLFTGGFGLLGSGLGSLGGAQFLSLEPYTLATARK